MLDGRLLGLLAPAMFALATTIAATGHTAFAIATFAALITQAMTVLALPR